MDVIQLTPNQPQTLLNPEELIEKVPEFSNEALLLLAADLVELRSIEPYPGWYFSIAETNASPMMRLRQAIWNTCRRRRLQKSILHPWYNNTRINLYLGNDLSWPTYIGGCIEPNEFAFMNSVLKPGMTMIDVGANDGIFTVFAASKVGKQGHILAFEPSAREFMRLQMNIQLNQLENVVAISKAGSNITGVAQLKISGYGHEGQNTLGNFAWDVQQISTEIVETCCLDMLPEIRNLDRLDFVKIDVEGAEYKVLQGVQETIQRFKPIILLELMDKALQGQNSTAVEVVQFLQSMGYIIHDFCSESGKPVPSNFNKHSDNIVASTYPLR